MGEIVDINDLEAGLAVLGVSSATKDAIQKILAPTADYVGAGVLSGAKAGVNLARVLVNATHTSTAYRSRGMNRFRHV